MLKAHFTLGNHKLVLSAIFLLSSIPICFMGYFSDESNLNTIAYQIATGDRFLREIWFLLYFSELLVAPFVWLYIKIFSGTTGMVLFLRILGCIISAVVSFSLYDTIKRVSNDNVAFLSALTFFLFSPSNMAFPNYKNISAWGILLVSLCFFNYFCCHKRKYLIEAGVFSVIGVFGYPTMAICVLFCLFLSFYLTNICDKRDRYVYTISLTGVGIVFLGLVLCTADMSNIKNIMQVFESDSHPINLSNILRNISIASGVGILLGVLPLVVSDYLAKKTENSKNKLLHFISVLLGCRPVIVMLVYIVFTIALYFNPFIVPNANTVCYSIGLLYFIMLVLYKQSKLENKRMLFLLFWVMPMISAFGVFLGSNQALPTVWTTPLIHAFPLLFLIIQKDWNGSEKDHLSRIYYRIFCVSICTILLFSRMFFVNSSSSMPDSLLSRKRMIEFGPAKYTFVSSINADYYSIYKSEFDLINTYCEPDESIYIIAEFPHTEPIGYLMSNARVAESIFHIHPSSNRIEGYFALNPDRVPKLVIVPSDYRKNQISNYKTTYFYSLLTSKYDYYEYNENISYYLIKN